MNSEPIVRPISPLSELEESARCEYWASLALRYCRGIGPRLANRLLRAYGSAYAALQNRKEWNACGIPQNVVAELNTGSWRIEAKEEWDRALKIDAAVLFWNDRKYPPRLRELPDPPLLLYLKGDVSLLTSPGVAIVGSRKATPQGRKVATAIARQLSSCGIAVVAGMAEGIDSAAHSGALDCIGRSIGILGTGIDRIYPLSEEKVYERMLEKGLLVSEFRPGTAPLRQNFPVRNRIISGLSLGVVIVEAAEHSGSLITARLALEQNREVYAVPGAAMDAASSGCQELVREGAKAVFNGEDILKDLEPLLHDFVPRASSSGACGTNSCAAPRGEMTHAVGADHPLRCQKRAGGAFPSTHVSASAFHADASIDMGCEHKEPAQLSENEERVLNELRMNGPLQVDFLTAALDIPSKELSVLLFQLELSGCIKRLSGARFEALC